MSDHHPVDPTDPDDGSGDDFERLPEVLRELFARLGITTPDGRLDMSALLRQMQATMAAMGTKSDSPSGVNWPETKALARRTLAGLGEDPTPSENAGRGVDAAFRLANLWLDQVSDLQAPELRPATWSRAEWVEATMDAWQTISEPIVTALASEMVKVMRPDVDPAELPPEAAQLQSMFVPMIRASAGAMYAAQLAQEIAKCATDVLSGTDTGLPLLAAPLVVLLPTNVAAFADGLAQDLDAVVLHLTLRETARQRLFLATGWLSSQILALLEHYAREITIDGSALTDVMDITDAGSLTPEGIAEMSEKLQGRLFKPTQTPEQVAILERLETLLALVEGWVDAVSAQAAAAFMPDEGALSEAVRRRRAAGGAAESLLKTIVGLELRPRRIRDAANLWAAVTQVRGNEARDELWRHPDLIPTSSDLDDPIGFAHGQSSPETDSMDAQLQWLVDEWRESHDED